MPAASKGKNCDISVKPLLHFCMFIVNPTWTLNLTISSESQQTDVSNNVYFPY